MVQFNGRVGSISWTDTPENYYGFTVGVAGPIPKPSEYLMLLGNGRIDAPNAGGTHEELVVWNHLSAAGFLNGSFTFTVGDAAARHLRPNC